LCPSYGAPGNPPPARVARFFKINVEELFDIKE
jgi:hypothetical protein